MPKTVSKTNPLGYLGVRAPKPPNITSSDRVPTQNDRKGYAIGDIWVQTNANRAFMLTSVASNVANWEEFSTASSTIFPVTPYVVGPVGEAGYQTVQAAIDAANAAAGEGVIWLQPGTYNENLAFPDNMNVTLMCGADENAGSAEIVGTHIPMTNGNLVIWKVKMTSTSDIFSSAVAGTAAITLSHNVYTVNGYIFDLVNWTGPLVMFAMSDFTSTSSGVVNNTAGAAVDILESSVGVGSGNPMIVSGPVVIEVGNIGCPVQVGSSAVVDFYSSNFSDTITLGDSVTGTIYRTYHQTGTASAITMSSSGAVSLLDITVDSTNANPIAGAGAGTLTMGSITFVQNSDIAATLTTSFVPFRSGEGQFDNLSFDGGTNTLDADGELVIGSGSGNPSIATLTAGSGISIVNGSGSITISNSASEQPITPFVVGPVGSGGYLTVQAALDASDTAGEFQPVWVQPGTYVENLTLYAGINIFGYGATITGVHTPPATGDVEFNGLKLTSATDILNSAVAGSGKMKFSQCEFNLTAGYVFNLLNWTGILEINNCSDISTDNGVANNTGGSQVVIVGSQLQGTTTMTTSANTFVVGSDFALPMNVNSAAGNLRVTASYLGEAVTLSNATAAIILDSTITSASSSIVHNSSGLLTLSNVALENAAADAIAGTGTVEIGSVILSGAVTTLAGTLTVNNLPLQSGVGRLDNLSFDGGTNIIDTDGQLVIGSTGANPVIGTLTGGNNITVTNGAGSITIDADTVLADTYTSDSGNAVPVAGVLNVLGGTGLNTTGAGNTVTVVADPEVPLSFPTDSGTATPAVNALTVSGANGIATSGSGATVTVDTAGIQAYNEIAGTSQAAAVSQGYIPQNVALTTITLPVTAAVGTIIKVLGKGAGGWTIAQNAGQNIEFNASATTVGVGGSLASTNANNAVELVCTTADTVWTVQSASGNLTVV